MIISTPRLYLREFSVEDAEMLVVLNNQPEVLQFTGDVPFDSIKAAQEFVEKYDHYKLHGFGRWTVVLKEGNLPIGWCGLKKHNSGMIDLGFRLIRSHWNQGFATEAAKACLNHGFNVLKFDEIIGRTASANRASIRVLEKLGFKYFKNDVCDGIPDSKYYRLKAK